MAELFTTFGVNWKLLLIQAVNFGVLLSALTYFLYKPVLEMLDERKALVAQGVQDAQEAKRRLSQAEDERQTIVGKAAQEAERIVMTARERGMEKEVDIVTHAQERSEALLKEAVERGDLIKREALKESEKQIAKAAVLAAEKILAAKA